jgi:hypothetical protein
MTIEQIPQLLFVNTTEAAAETISNVPEFDGACLHTKK